MAFDIRTVLRASLVIIGAGVALVVISMILKLLPLLIKGSAGEIITLIGSIYEFLMIPAFLALFFWAGMRAVSQFKLDAIGAGAVSAFSYILTGLVHLVLGTLLNIIVMSQVIGGATFGSAETQLASALFGDIMGAAGIGVSAFCGLGIIVFGAMINFVVGGFGGLFALRK